MQDTLKVLKGFNSCSLEENVNIDHMKKGQGRLSSTTNGISKHH